MCYSPSRSLVKGSSPELNIPISLYAPNISCGSSYDMIGFLLPYRIKRFEGNSHFIVPPNTILLSNSDDRASLLTSGCSWQFSKLSCSRIGCEEDPALYHPIWFRLQLPPMLIAELQFWSVSDAWTNILYYGWDWYQWINLGFT